MKSYASITGQKSVFTAPVHNQCNLKAEGEPEKGVACLLHIFPQFVFNTYSLPSKGEKEGVYYTILKKSKLLLVNVRMISAKETSSGTK